MREQKVFVFWVVKGMTDQAIKEKYQREVGELPTDEQLPKLREDSVTYEGELALLSTELDSFLTAIFEGTSDILKFKFLSIHYEEVYTKKDVDEIVDEATQEFKNKLDQANDYFSEIESKIDDLKSQISDIEYFADEIEDSARYGQDECDYE